MRRQQLLASSPKRIGRGRHRLLPVAQARSRKPPPGCRAGLRRPALPRRHGRRPARRATSAASWRGRHRHGGHDRLRHGHRQARRALRRPPRPAEERSRPTTRKPAAPAATANRPSLDGLRPGRRGAAAPDDRGRRGRRGAQARSQANGAARVASPAIELPAHATARFIALRTWRAEAARAQNVPAYVIFHDATLRSIAIESPGDLDALACIGGVGASKLERYGREVIAALEASQ
jgi:superfamily II DNA helicase RecQ